MENPLNSRRSISIVCSEFGRCERLMDSFVTEKLQITPPKQKAKPFMSITTTDAFACVILLLLVVTICFSFFGRYAFDDSYFGYSAAQSMVLHKGYSFNGDRVLSTSAPLAPPLYALFSLPFHGDIVFIAQVFSVAALLTIAFAAFVLARTICDSLGALLTAVALVTSPFVVLLWSHETLLYVACALVGLVLFSRDRHIVAAVVIGFAALFRGEALIVLPFVAALVARRFGLLEAVKFSAYGVLPFLTWCVIAVPLFGSPFSSTIASKHAQLRYVDVDSFFVGLRDFAGFMYGFTTSLIWLHIVEIAIIACIGCVIAMKRHPWVEVAIGAWAIVAIAIYIVLQLPFYFWFCVPVGVGMAALVGFVWRRNDQSRSIILRYVGRVSAVVIVVMNVAFAMTQVISPDTKQVGRGMIVMPRIASNTYRRIGEYFKNPRHRSKEIAFIEIGQLRYYSEPTKIIDYLGIVTPDAVHALANQNAIWTFKRYAPQTVLDLATFHYFVDPVEYDWFQRAYGVAANHEHIDLAGDRSRQHFEIYRLKDRSAIPPADERVLKKRVSTVNSLRNGISFTFDAPSAPLVEIEARVLLPVNCPTVMIRISGDGVDLREKRSGLVGRIVRLSMRVHPPLRVGQYNFVVSGCRNIEAAPPTGLRSGFVIFGNPLPPPAVLGDALNLYS